MLNYFNSNYFMNYPTLVEATIRAKVLAKHLIQKDYKRNYELIVMIQKMSYIIVDKKTSETKTGSIEAESFMHKAKFWFHGYMHNGEMKRKLSDLVSGDVINFSIMKKCTEYKFLSMEVENEKHCYHADELVSLIETCSKNC